MAGPIAYSAPYQPPRPPGWDTVWQGLSMTWEGWDGSVWSLTDADGGVYLPRGGVRGMGTPEAEVYTSSAAGVAGARMLGARVLPREVFWPIEVYTDQGSQAWLDLDSAFWRTMDQEKPGVWTVSQPGAAAGAAGSRPGQRRSLDCYFVTDGGHAFEIDRSLVGWEVYAVRLVAHQPYWRGDPIVRGPWIESEGQDFIPATGAPPFYISEGHQAARASMPNPGDVATVAIWRVRGTDAGTAVGVGGEHTVIPFDLADDQEVVLDSDNQLATLNRLAITHDAEGREVVEVLSSEDVTGEIEVFDGGKVPPGASVPLDVVIAGTGAGQVSASLVPLYRRAW